MACLNEAMGKGRKTLVLVIAKLRKKYTLKALLNYTKLAKSTYYDALKKLSREDKYKGLKTLIHNICNKNHGRYGYRRVTLQLHKQGIKVNHKVVMRLMKEETILNAAYTFEQAIDFRNKYKPEFKGGAK